MQCPKCGAEGISFWQLWLSNLRQRVSCEECETLFRIFCPERVAAGTFGVLLLAGIAIFLPGWRGMGFALFLFCIVANFVLTHHYVELHEEQDPGDAD